jgi:hypothetical protein
MAGWNAIDWDMLALDLNANVPNHRSSGWTLDVMASYLQVRPWVAAQAVHHHRVELDDDTAALLCEHGPGARYWLSLDPDEIKYYSRKRYRHVSAQIRTVHRVMARAVKLTSGRTTEGKLVRMAEMDTRQAMERFEALEELVS